MIVIVVFGIFEVMLLALGVIAFLKKKYKHPWGCFFLAFVLQMILALPAVIYQIVAGWPDISSSVQERLTAISLAVPFNTGGWTIRYLFEHSAGLLELFVGTRSSEVLSNMDYYLFLLVMQMSFIAFLVGVRWYKKKSSYDFIAVIALALMFVNSLLNVQWFWAGS